MQETKLYDIKNNQAKISLQNLTVGQSGIIVHKTLKNKIIIDQAVITQSNDSYSTIKFLKQDILPQNAIPTSKLKPRDGDMFVLNHLYQTSLLIVPNLETKKYILDIYSKQNFLNEDFFASYLKLINEPIPTKEDILAFTKKQQIGTIFVVVQEKLFIVDSLSFKVIDSVDIKVEDNSTQSPFLTKIDKITRSFFDFGAKKIENYNKYYLKLLGITND
jgi:hypothetical protein